MKKNFSRNIFNPKEVRISNFEFKLDFDKHKQNIKKTEQEIIEGKITILKNEKIELINEIEKIKQDQKNLNKQKKKEQVKHEQDLSDKVIAYQKKLDEEKKIIISNTKKEIKELNIIAKNQEQEIIEKAKQEEENIIEASKKIGHEEGFEKGYEEGKVERERIEVFLKKILEETINKRDQVLDRFQQHLIEIILLIVKKVVKKIANKDQEIVIENINACLKKIQGPVNITIRINTSNFKTVEKFKEKLLSSLSTLNSINLIDDPTIDPGGCIIETDLALIDGKISSQLEKIEKIITSTNII